MRIKDCNFTTAQNEIVVYQPNELVRLEVRVQDDSVWLTQAQMCELFQRDVSVVSRHIKNVFSEGEVDRESNLHLLQIANSDRPITVYSLNVIISVGYRVKSPRGTQFRIWATKVLREYLLRGFSVNARINHLEDRIDRRLAKHAADIVELKDKVDFFVRTSQPPVQGVFYDGQVFDARVFAAKHILSAKKSILLIDSWVGIGTLENLAKKKSGVSVEIVTTPRGNKLQPADIEAFNNQYGGLTVKTSTRFHDRFLIIDDKRLYLIGASLKDLGWKCFAFTQLDSIEIGGLKSRI